MEWRDELGSDYEFSDGRVVSAIIYSGNKQKAERTYNEVDSIFASRYHLTFPAKAEDWEESLQNPPCMKYINFYEFGTKTVSVALHLYSQVKNENNVDKAEVIIGLGNRNTNQ